MPQFHCSKAWHVLSMQTPSAVAIANGCPRESRDIRSEAISFKAAINTRDFEAKNCIEFNTVLFQHCFRSFYPPSDSPIIDTPWRSQRTPAIQNMYQ